MKSENFVKANRDRTINAAARTVDQANAALDIIDTVPVADHRARMLRPRYRLVLQARVANPDKSLAEIAAELRISKDTYSAALRRALGYASRIAAAHSAGRSL
jgi:DNA-binding transcriptional regulator WhiA